ncbi:MAG: imidazole glycerol phosphate synthase subunit HisH [Prevotellaceae bacterium]|nr:imidazole glycerol phosphate synthase subunit HisH [Prevotellaceae bacterium]
MNIVIIKYNAGNIRSVLYALERLGYEAVVRNNPEVIRRADRVIFPGVGEAASAMAYLREHNLDKVICSLTQPVLGICLGLQLMCTHSEEGNAECLGIFPQQVKRFPATEKIPQIGWNNLFEMKSPVFEGIKENAYVYFVHGYYAETGKDTIAKAHYTKDYSAALHKNNFYAMQFHPEKSGDVGEMMLKNFIELKTEIN